MFFEGDMVAREKLAHCAHFYRASFEASLEEAGASEIVILVSMEHLLKEHQQAARAPNVRVVALSDTRFKDPRLDGSVYAYLPTNTPAALVERILDNAVDHIHLLVTRQDANERLAGATHEINELNKIGAALSAEHDTAKLLAMILTKCREITKADAGSLYLVEEKVVEKEGNGSTPESRQQHEKILRFKLAQNDSIDLPFREVTLPISEKSVAGYVAAHGETVMIEDAYRIPPDMPYKINRKFDEDSGYRTKSVLAVAMRNPKDEIVGVVQLINAKREWTAKLNSVSSIVHQVLPFTPRQQEIVSSLASQAAVAYENSQLYENIRRLFEGFVKASVTAIEARDPTTSGHSFRVANLTVALAEAVDRDTNHYDDVRFTREEMREIRYASLLHDFGKVGVREEVLVKARKLYPAQMELVRQRFDFVRRTLEAETNRRRLEYVLEKGREKYLKQIKTFDAKLSEELAELDRSLQVIIQANEPTVLPAGSFDDLLEIAAKNYPGWDGEERRLLNEDEVKLLSIRKGSLDDAERLEIESHVVHTYNFLQQIPWTKEIRNIPQIARGHHEKLNGTGYPYKLSAPEIPLQTRLMTVSDVFDALSASDRPYKRAVSTQKALDILELMVKDGELDSHVFQLFLDAKVYERWKVEPFAY